MGNVYLARASGPGGFSKLLIIKELNAKLGEDPMFLTMFLEEARIAARLEHVNIVQTIEVGQDGTRPYIAMEYLQGQPLDRIRRRAPASSTDALLRVLTEMLHGLHYAHTLKDYDGSDLGLVHRDVSPTNVFVTYDGAVKLMDFGIAKAADSQVETQTGLFKGKAAYMAPEQLTGRGVDARSDIYAAGVVLFEIVSRSRFWQGVSDLDRLQRTLSGEIPTLEATKPDAPPELVRICGKAMALQPEHRYHTAEALRIELDRYLATRPAVPTLRELGALVGDLFAKEREELRGHIERVYGDLKNRNSSLLTAVGTTSSSSIPVITPSGHAAPIPGDPPESLTTHAKAPPLQRPESTKKRAVILLALPLVPALLVASMSLSRKYGASVAPRPAATMAPRAVANVNDLGNPPAASPTAPAGSGEAPQVASASPAPAPSAAPASRGWKNPPRSVPMPRPPLTIAAHHVPAPTPTRDVPNPSKQNCALPFFVDERGIRHFKPECGATDTK